MAASAPEVGMQLTRDKCACDHLAPVHRSCASDRFLMFIAPCTLVNFCCPRAALAETSVFDGRRYEQALAGFVKRLPSDSPYCFLTKCRQGLEQGHPADEAVPAGAGSWRSLL